jgi:carboxypeptidase C (cathepsin A)
MGGPEFVLALSAIGCGTAVIITFIDKAFGLFGTNKHKARMLDSQRQLELAEERSRYQDVRIVELSRQNEQLQKQLEWHGKLLETQDQMLRRLDADEPARIR